MPPRTFDGNFSTFRQFIHPGDRETFARTVGDALQAGTDFLIEFRVPSVDGAVRWIRGQGRVFRDEAGSPDRVIGVGLDVTARREEERATLQMGVIANASDDAIVAVTPDGVVTAWNGGATRLYGCDAGEMIGRSICQLVPPESADELDAILDRLRRGECIANLQTERVTKDGRRVPVSISSGPTVDQAGRIIEAATIARDVTQQRHEAARQRRFADIGAAITSSIDTATALAEAARVIARDMADWCAVHLVGHDGDIERPAVMQYNPARVTWERSEQASVPNDAAPAMGVLNVIRTGIARFYPAVAVAESDRRSENNEVAAALDAAGIRSAIVIPLVARSKTIGALSLYRQEGRPRFDDEDLLMAAELGQRVAFAVENALLFRRVADAEKHLRLVPDNLPALVSYIGADWRYRFVNRRYEAWFDRPGIHRHARRPARERSRRLHGDVAHGPGAAWGRGAVRARVRLPGQGHAECRSQLRPRP